MSRSAQQEAISRGVKAAWKRRREDEKAETEAMLHRAVAEYLGWVLHPPVIWTTLGHGGGGRVRGAQLKAMGLKPGWPDILIIAPGPNVLGIELKRPGKGGSQTPEQRQLEAAFHGCKAWYVLCRSVEEVGKALDYIRIPKSVHNVNVVIS